MEGTYVALCRQTSLIWVFTTVENRWITFEPETAFCLNGYKIYLRIILLNF